MRPSRTEMITPSPISFGAIEHPGGFVNILPQNKEDCLIFFKGFYVVNQNIQGNNTEISLFDKLAIILVKTNATTFREI